ncbi:MAG TPA: PAAR domain-containing protein [Bryobacteraceae bacterium]
MGLPAARVGDLHVCPMANGPVPHVGGPILPPGAITVLIGGMPAARMGDQATCVGPPDVIALGSFTVLTGGQPQARVTDISAHGGNIVLGCFTVLVG